MLRRLLALLAITIGLIATLVPTSTTTASASAFTYDAPAVARADVHEFGRTDARTAQVTSVWERSASPPMEARGTVTTLVTLSNATEAGYTASKINITEDGLNHVFDRHLADGSLSAGKSLFNDNVSITRLIADADAVVPGVQGNGNLAYVVDAGRAIGVDRVTGQATSIYTVITKPGGDLVTAFPGTP